MIERYSPMCFSASAMVWSGLRSSGCRRGLSVFSLFMITSRSLGISPEEHASRRRRPAPAPCGTNGVGVSNLANSRKTQAAVAERVRALTW